MKLNFVKSIFLLIVLLVANSVQVSAQSKNIYSAYLRCEFACTAIKINPDFTFDHLLDGDLFNGKRTKGTWKFIGKNKIKAESPKPSGAPPVKETLTNRADDFIVIVTDFAGAIIPTAEVSGIANGENFKCLTDEDGICRIPKCKQFEVEFLKYRGTHQITNSKADNFVVELTNEQMETTVIDDVWLIEGNRLYKQNSEGKIDKEFYLEKVSRKRQRKLFP